MLHRKSYVIFVSCDTVVSRSSKPNQGLLPHCYNALPVIACTCLCIVGLLLQLCSLSATAQGVSASGISGRTSMPSHGEHTEHAS